MRGICTICGREFDKTHGNQKYCSEECRREKRRRSYRDNREYKIEYSKIYYQKHADMVKDYQKRYRKTHKDKMRLYQRDYYKENKSRILDKRKERLAASRLQAG